MTVATASPQTAMKRLAGGLALVCLGLFLLAIEQKHAVAAWATLRDETGPASRRIADWAGRLPSTAALGFEEVRSAVARQVSVPSVSRVAAPGSDEVLSAGSAPSAVLTPAGSLTLVGAELRFGNGETVRTRPLRIASGREAFAPGQTFARRFRAPADAQIELREIVPPLQGQAAEPLSLCGGQPAGIAALLHRRDRVDLMLFRGPAVGPDSPASDLCGVWSFPAR